MGIHPGSPEHEQGGVAPAQLTRRPVASIHGHGRHRPRGLEPSAVFRIGRAWSSGTKRTIPPATPLHKIRFQHERTTKTWRPVAALRAFGRFLEKKTPCKALYSTIYGSKVLRHRPAAAVSRDPPSPWIPARSGLRPKPWNPGRGDSDS